jgi:hypothetical protein
MEAYKQTNKQKRLHQRIKYRTMIKENNLTKNMILDFLKRHLQGREFIEKFTQVVEIDL